jgi:hypothetical protein
LTNELQDVKQLFLQNDLVLTGLPDLKSFNVNTLLQKIAEIYQFAIGNFASTNIISGINKATQKPFNLMFISMRSADLKMFVLSKQKSVGPILWDQLAENVPENVKTNKLRFNGRLTQYKQSILVEGKAFSKENRDKVPYVWEKNGRILLKESNETRPVELHSLADLDLIKKKYEPQDEKI